MKEELVKALEGYVLLSGSHGYNNDGDFGYAILIKTDKTLDSEDGHIGSQAIEQLRENLTRHWNLSDPAKLAAADAEKKSLLACFPVGMQIYVEQIPNGYCSRACCAHLPWFIVTTPKGRIKIGWRKQVINIDWSDSIIKINGYLSWKNAVENNELDSWLTDDGVTKGHTIIHAWDYKKATEYLARLLG